MCYLRHLVRVVKLAVNHIRKEQDDHEGNGEAVTPHGALPLLGHLPGIQGCLHAVQAQQNYKPHCSQRGDDLQNGVAVI